MEKQLTQNQIDYYKSLQKQDTENRKLIRKLQGENEEMKQALKQAHVIGRSELLAAFQEFWNEKPNHSITDKDIREFLSSQ